jgi:hypothetical protein
VAAGDPGPPPVPSLLQPTWLLTGFTLETVGSLTVSGRDTLRVTATPRPGRWDGPAAGRRQVDRVEVIVDSELGILLRHEEILDGSPLRVVAAGSAAVLAMAVWLLIYRSVSAPVNRQLTAAARDGRLPGDARALQRQWDHVINARAALQTAAVAALCAALILS